MARHVTGKEDVMGGKQASSQAAPKSHGSQLSQVSSPSTVQEWVGSRETGCLCWWQKLLWNPVSVLGLLRGLACQSVLHGRHYTAYPHCLLFIGTLAPDLATLLGGPSLSSLCI